ncbi:O-methyltransferase [Pseudomassariella vexata]|uniref:O-methyltransferase n=1 Tax=Pseudomassariella vexata TaxID=1141098 RepID=A0A1Y2DMT7_9PEZI|nr:O-methyltransferase [Pseudomassariella vexata]ORY60582.1 O-methyltransferase [Pseudomassariella vexata]
MKFPSSMSSLAQKISRETEKVEMYFRDRGLPLPSFDADAPGDFENLPEDIARSRREVIQTTSELRDLMVSPKERVRWLAWDFLGTQSLQLLSHFGIPKLVPIEGTITLTELQSKTTLDPTNLARVLRHAMTKRIFIEPSPGVIAHTAASRLLVEDESLNAWVGFNTEDIYPASSHVLEAITKYPEATNLTRTGFNVAFNTVDQEPMFVTFGKDPKRARRMALAMSSLTGGEGYEVSYLVNEDIFSDIDARGGTLVDMGGSHGFISVDLAKRYRNMRFIVQDLPKTVSSAPNPISDDTQVVERVVFQAHDFFTPQVAKDADVYFFRWIIHNYSKPYAVQILRNLIPALKPGARIVINDICLKEPGMETPWNEQLIRSMDMVMMTLLNAQERQEWEFRELFELADKGFVFKGITRPKGCRLSIVNAVWKPDEVGKNFSLGLASGLGSGEDRNEVNGKI